MNTKNRIIGKNGLLAAGTAVLMIASASAAFTTSRTIVNHNRYDTVEIGLQEKRKYLHLELLFHPCLRHKYFLSEVMLIVIVPTSFVNLTALSVKLYMTWSIIALSP